MILVINNGDDLLQKHSPLCILYTQQEDVEKVHRLLRWCSRHLDLQLEGGCQGPNGCGQVPKECLMHDAVYTILHYLIDAAFLNPEVRCYFPRTPTSHAPPSPPPPLPHLLMSPN